MTGVAYAAWPLQKAMYSRLTTNANTSSYTVTDNADAALPYIRVGEDETQPYYTTTSPGADVYVTIHVYGNNSKTVKEMMAAVEAALSASPALDLSADDQVVLCEPFLQSVSIFDESDPETNLEQRHGVMRFRYMTHYKAS